MIQYKNNQIIVFQSALYQTTSTVIETPDLVLVVDPTWLPHEVINIRNYVDQIRKERPVFLLFTHSDWDHVIGYKAFHNVTTIASREFAENPEKEAVLEQIRAFDDKYYIQRDYDIAYPDIDIAVREDGQKLVVGGTCLTFYKSPGHIYEGLFTIVEPIGAFIAGDYLSNVEFPYIFHSSIEYEQTLHKAKDLLDRYPVELLIPGHGQATDDLQEMRNRCNRSFQYIRDLRDALLRNDEDQAQQLIRDQPFLRNVKNYHESNLTLVKKELGMPD